MSGEFDLIRQYFTRKTPAVSVGVGDDCAVFDVPAGAQLATSTDLLLEGQHFFSDVSPYALGHKALAVNLSDLAAMGAKPAGCLLGIGLPELDNKWLEAFSAGFYDLANKHACPLIGGDTTRSEQGIVISVTVFGSVTPPLLTRSSAKENDDIWVSGVLGGADIALSLLVRLNRGQPLDKAETALLEKTRSCLETPIPRVELGMALYNLAHAVIDISDGLLQDLGHILKASGKGAVLYASQLPVNPLIAGLDQEAVLKAVLGGGDVYELCFTAPPSVRDSIQQKASELDIPVSRIGSITAETGLKVLNEDLIEIHNLPYGFDHFR